MLVKVGEIRNGAFLDDLSRKVRNGQEGRVLDDCGSAEDYCFG